jgi:hypothetical protein
VTAPDDRAEALANQLRHARIAATEIADARDLAQSGVSDAQEADSVIRPAYRAVIYLHGDSRNELHEMEMRCREYAAEFGWDVQRCLRDVGDQIALRWLVALLPDLDLQIIVTGTLDMISPDQDTRDGMMAAIERSRVLVHPVCSPARAGALAGAGEPQ